MTYVVDASVAIKWFVREPLHDQALLLLDHRERLETPDFIVPEVANIAWKKFIRGEITEGQARLITTAIRQYIPRLRPTAEITEQALGVAVALDHAVYDCLYIACADSADGVLITADKELCDAVRETDFACLVRYLGDPDFIEGENETLPPLQIPLRKVEHVIREADLLLKADTHLDEKFPEDRLKGMSNKELRDLFLWYTDSINRRRLASYIDNLPFNERVDLLALTRQGTTDQADWHTLRREAQKDVQGSATGSGFGMSLNSQLADRLRRGLAVLRRKARLKP